MTLKIDEDDPIVDPRDTTADSFDDPWQREGTAFIALTDEIEHPLCAWRIKTDPSNIELAGLELFAAHDLTCIITKFGEGIDGRRASRRGEIDVHDLNILTARTPLR